MNNLPSYCGLVDAKIRASDKDLPVPNMLQHRAMQCNIICMYYMLLLSKEKLNLGYFNL